MFWNNLTKFGSHSGDALYTPNPEEPDDVVEGQSRSKSTELSRPCGPCRLLRECLLPGFPKGNRVTERERVPNWIMAGDQDAATPVVHCYLPELGLGVIEQFVTLAGRGGDDFQWLEGLTSHGVRLSVMCDTILGIS